MSNFPGQVDPHQDPQQPAWSAVASLTLGVFSLVTAEFLPASLLTPMAADLGITEGMAGQTVTATAIVAFAASLLVAAMTKKTDRRLVLLAFSALLVMWNLLVAFAPGIMLLLLGRIFLGIALGGFWAMSAAVAMRLVSVPMVPRAMSIIFSGISVATILAAPAGSYLGDIVGWRSVFLIAAALAGLTFIVQLATLPRMPPSGLVELRTLFDLLKRADIKLAVAAVMLTFTGHFAFFTYIRPFLETVASAGIDIVSAILLGFGLANFLGTLLAGPMIKRSLWLTLMSMPLLMGALGLGLVGTGTVALIDAVMIAAWGLAFGTVPVAWSTWLARTAPDKAESAGGLLVATMQFAIAVGAAGGGAIFDKTGAAGVFTASAILLLLAAAVVLICRRSSTVVATT